MRSLSAPVVLSSLVLTGWLTGAAAQDVNNTQTTGTDTSPAALAADQQAANIDESVAGLVPFPTLASPGLVIGARLREIYTDNLTFAGPGQPKESSWVTAIEPFVRAAYDSPRLSGTLYYRLTGYLYPGRSNANQVSQNLNAQGTYTILPQHLFIDGTALYSRQIINNQLPSGVGSGNFFLDNNSANVAIYSLSPYWVQQFGSLATAVLRYTYGRVMYDRSGISGDNSQVLSGIPDVTSNGVQFTAFSPQDERAGWNFGYSQQRLRPDFGNSVQFAVAQVGGYYRLNESVRLLADAGKEDKYLPDGTIDHLGASFWDAGFEWASPRNQLKVLVGHRFFGRSAQVSWTHTAALLTTNVSYIEQPTDLNRELMGGGMGLGFGLGAQGFGLGAQGAGLGGQGFGEFTTEGNNLRGIPSLLDFRPYLMKRATASATYQMPTSNLTFRVLDESRKFFFSSDFNNGSQLGSNDKLTEADVAWAFNLGPRTSLTPRVGWQRYRFSSDQVSYTHFAELRLAHRISDKDFGSVRLRNESENVLLGVPGAHGYRVNILYAEWTHLF